MSSKHDIIIGLEVHIQLKLNTKLFCNCSTQPCEEPNMHVCPTCLGHPGSKPLLNKKAIEAAIKLALALGTKINHRIHFSRKSYFYPDLAKSYQITQYEIPVATDGFVVLSSGKTVGLSRLHIEEDPASLTHTGTICLIDYNRSGIPLIELVTKPDMHSPEEAREFLNILIIILQYLDIFDPNIGIMKADANISIAKKNYTRVEIKNILGFKEIERALAYEIKRQQSHEVVRETRGWDSIAGQTCSMRKKEEESDYGYIFDPDITPITITQEYIEDTRKKIPELPRIKAQRYHQILRVDATDAHIIASDLTLALLFEGLAAHHNPVLVARWLRRELLRVLNLFNKKISDVNLQHLHELFDLVETRTITDKIGQQLIEDLARKDFSPKQRVFEQKLSVVSDEEFIKKACMVVIAQNKSTVEDYKKGEEKALHFLFGKVMAATKGKAKPDIIKKMLEESI